MYLVVTNRDLKFSFDPKEIGLEIKKISVQESLDILEPLDLIAYDSETTGLNPHEHSLISMQFGNEDFQIYVDTLSVDPCVYKDLFSRKDKTFVMQNAIFDLSFLYSHEIVVEKIFDTYLAETVLYLGYNNPKRSLDHLVYKYCNEYISKAIRKDIHLRGLTLDVIDYSCKDVKYLLPIRKAQLIEAEKKEVVKAINFENAFVKVLAYVQRFGIGFDYNAWEKLLEKNTEILNEKTKALNDWVVNRFGFPSPFTTKCLQNDLFGLFSNAGTISCTINWDSPKQKVEFFNSLGYDLKVKNKKTKKISESTAADVILRQDIIPELNTLYKELSDVQTLVKSFGQNYLNIYHKESGRIYSTFKQLVSTGRMACGSDKEAKKDQDFKPNLQNVPARDDFRKCFIPKEGYYLIDCDYTAMEDLVFTQKSMEPKLIEFYNDKTRKRDGHSFVAKICFPVILKDVPEEDVKHKFPELRKQAKTAKFAIHYGGNGATIAKNLNLKSVEEGFHIEQAYLSGFSRINEYFEECKSDMREKGYILMCKKTGHKRFIEGFEELSAFAQSVDRDYMELYYRARARKDFDDPVYIAVNNFKQRVSKEERNSLNAPIQGEAAIITKYAAILYFRHLQESNLLFKVFIPNLVHDELLIEAPEELSEQEKYWVQKCMEDSANIFVKIVKLKAEALEPAKYWVH